MPSDKNGAGFLSKKQRDYLKRREVYNLAHTALPGSNEGDFDSGMKPADERAIRGRIRGRVGGVLRDFHLLRRGLEDRDRRKAFGDIEDEVDSPISINYITDVFAFFFTALLDPETVTSFFETDEAMFTYIIENALGTAFSRQKQHVKEITVTIDIDRFSPEGLTHRKGGLAELDEKLLKDMLQRQEITSDEFVQAIEEKRESGPSDNDE